MPLVKAVIASLKGTFSGTGWVQALLAVACVATIIYLSIVGLPIPDVLSGVVWCIMGFYFGSRKAKVAGGERGAGASLPPLPPLRRTRQGRGRTRLIHFQGVYLTPGSTE